MENDSYLICKFCKKLCKESKDLIETNDEDTGEVNYICDKFEKHE